MSPKSAKRFWDNDMHKTMLKARRLNPFNATRFRPTSDQQRSNRETRKPKKDCGSKAGIALRLGRQTGGSRFEAEVQGLAADG
ncbi:hypothetical protein [Mesorhizobium wenxiniae]|uniref:hypothetical protein n=1 Tax=Mesorhizobium wenxiniae TaxID=2014805 RepID=UPI001FD9E52B|nr:hypothetical protein [Mesorhizobium wenxiniae]